jgi:hypothetical protein
MSGWRDAFDAQMGLWRWLRSPVGRGSMDLRMQDFMRGMNDQSRDLTMRLRSVEEVKLEGADPIFVSGEMCDLIDYATDPGLAEPFLPEPLYVTDLPTLSGFLLYEKPFDVLDRFDTPIKIAGFSWTPLFGHDPDDPPPKLTDETSLRDWLDNEGADGRSHGIALTIYVVGDPESYRTRGLVSPPVEITHFTPWYFGMTFDGNEFDTEGKPTGAGWWWRILQVTFRLMQQQIAVQQRQYGPRPQRRQAKRLGFTDREVLVVRLRRERSKPTEDEHGLANYSHRFIVSGHWRNQWYPASNDHRQIWISPYVKGGESLPLVVKPRRAFVLNR